MLQQSTVDLEDARRMIVGGEAKAHDLGQPMNIAVVDKGGNLVAFAHMDGAWKGSVDIAINKASLRRCSSCRPGASPRKPSRKSLSTASRFPITAA